MYYAVNVYHLLYHVRTRIHLKHQNETNFIYKCFLHFKTFSLEVLLDIKNIQKDFEFIVSKL